MLKPVTTDIEALKIIEERLRWLSAWTIHNANHLRESKDGLKVGGHQASCASMTAIMAALYFHALGPNDRVAVKPHAGPVLHAIHYLLGTQSREALENFGKRNPSPTVSEFVASVIQAEEEGTPLSEVLQIQATVSRQRRGVRAEEAASKASLQLLMPMGLVFVSVLCLIGGPLVLKLMEEFGRGI